jgi:ABC-type multidrug transport system fused ATPase/permease subunit
VLGEIRRAFGLLDRRERRRWAALVPLAAVGAAAEALGAAAVFFLVRVITDPRQAARIPLIAPWVAASPDPRQVLVRVTIVVIAFYLARNVVLLAVESIQERVIQGSALAMSTRLLAACLAAPYRFHFRRTSSALVHDLREGVDIVVSQVLAPVIHLASEVMIAAGLLVLLALAAPTTTAMALGTMLALLTPIVMVSRRRFGAYGEKERALSERLIAELTQSLGAIKAILLGAHQDHFTRRFALGRRALALVRERRGVVTLAIRLAVETSFICAMMLAVVVMTLSGRSATEMVSLLGLYAYAGFRIVPSANRLMLNLNSLRYGQAFVAPLADDWALLGTEPRLLRSSAAASSFTTEIVVDRVSYAYEDGRPDALNDVSLTIRRGESVGIVGLSGAGKSTLVDVILGLLPPTRGRVMVDGRNIAEALERWQPHIGYVPQSPAIVGDSLRRNVAFGVDDEAIDERRLAEAIRIARLSDLVGTLPRGLDTPLGEHGARLSGGERQRIAIARALYHDPAVLVFDEATSALDDQTEREIVEAIDALRGTRTIIVIAHRASTVRTCDRLIVLDRGRISSLVPS